MPLSQAYSTKGGQDICADGQRPWRHITWQGTEHCKCCCPCCENRHRMNIQPPPAAHTQNACSACVSHGAGVYVYQHKKLLTVSVWGKEEGKCRGDAFCAIQSFQTYAWWFCFNQEVIWMVTFTKHCVFLHTSRTQRENSWWSFERRNLCLFPIARRV